MYVISDVAHWSRNGEGDVGRGEGRVVGGRGGEWRRMCAAYKDISVGDLHGGRENKGDVEEGEEKEIGSEEKNVLKRKGRWKVGC